MNNHFQYHISNMDMKEFYKKICQLPDCPSIIVVDELEEGEILRKTMGNHDILYLKHQSEDAMLDVLEKELLLKEATVAPALPFENHSLSNKAVMDWLLVATIISDLLAIKVPQIMFTQGRFKNGVCFTGHGLIVLADHHSPYDIQASESFIVMAHELRHEWQHQYHEDWFANYPNLESIRTKKGYNLYCNHLTEIDAEAFAIKLASIIFSGVEISEKNEKLKKKYISRANEIDIPTSDSIIRLKSVFSYAN